MGQIKAKGESKFVGSTLSGIKEINKNVYSKKEGKHIDVTEYKGTFKSSNGTFFTLKVSKTSEEKYEKDGTAYWVEIAEFGSKSNNRER